jgi:hypothetical protein
VVRRARCLPIGLVQTVPGLCSCSVPTHVALDNHATQRQLARAARPPRFHKVGAPLFEWGSARTLTKAVTSAGVNRLRSGRASVCSSVREETRWHRRQFSTAGRTDKKAGDCPCQPLYLT